jgi:geranylgeranyl diphosphate synthase type II
MVKQMLSEYSEIIENRIYDFLPSGDPDYKILTDAMRYSLSAGGKRIRPSLTLEFCRICGGSIDDAIACACAVEMIHTYSLIHDDLPCMDNDDFRRGKPSCHRAFGEDTALLAGDGLLTNAFLTAAKTPLSVGPSRIVRAIAELSRLSGADGMVGGQVIDLQSEGKDADTDILLKMYSLKTGALIEAACVMGCIIAGADDDIITAAREYAQAIGAAFQIRDDILDAIGDQNLLGKPTGSDAANKKSTFTSKTGLDKSNQAVIRYTSMAKDSLAPFGERADRLAALADYLASREK